jgi:hypothetical protein
VLPFFASCQQLHPGVCALPNPFGRYEEAVVERDEVSNAAIVDAEALWLLVGVSRSFELGKSYL